MNLYIVTGTSSGIGKHIVELLLTNPLNQVIGISRNNTISHPNYTHHFIDLLQIQTIKKFEMPNIEIFSKVVLINNAGILGEIAPLKSINIDQIESCIQVNYTALMILCTLYIQAYQNEAITKTIINISSGAATSPYASWTNYCSSKSAVVMLTKMYFKRARSEEYPIHCFAIAPGVVDTNMQKLIRNTSIDKLK